MIAWLTTRCGCRRSMRITYPPPPEIHLPMTPTQNPSRWVPEPTDRLYDGMARRIFRLVNHPEHPTMDADYTESSTYDP